MILLVLSLLLVLGLLWLLLLPGQVPGSIFLVLPPVGRLLHVDLESVLTLSLGLTLTALLALQLIRHLLNRRFSEVKDQLEGVDAALRELLERSPKQVQEDEEGKLGELTDQMRRVEGTLVELLGRTSLEGVVEDVEELEVNVKEEEVHVCEIVDPKTLKLLFSYKSPQA